MSDHDQRELARRLREAREFMNVSQQFVSDQTGIQRSAISDIERGTRKVESLELKRLAALFRMPVEYFLGPDDDGPVAGAGATPAPDPTVEALARTAAEMDDAGKQEVLRFATFLRNYQRKER